MNNKYDFSTYTAKEKKILLVYGVVLPYMAGALIGMYGRHLINKGRKTL